MVVAALVVLFGKLFKWEAMVGFDLWWLILIAFGAVFAARLLLAPYWIYKDIKRKHGELKSQLTSKVGKGEIREVLGKFLVEGQELEIKCMNEKESPPNDEANKWASQVEHYLSRELDSSYIAIFRNTASVPMGISSISSIPHRDLSAGLHARLYQLEQILGRLGD